MKAVKFIHTHFDSGLPKYEAGKTYPHNVETARQVALGHAEEVNVDAGQIEGAAQEERPAEKSSKKQAAKQEDKAVGEAETN